MMLNKPTYTVEEAAKLLGCHYITMIRAIRAGKLKAAKLGRDYRISRKDLEEFWVSSGGGQLMEETVSEIQVAFEQVCADRREDPGEIVKNLMAEYVRAVREAKAQEADQEADEALREIVKKRKTDPKVKI